MKENITKALHNRFACTKYNAKKKISADDFALIIESAHLSPSSFGLEPWKVLVIKKEELFAKLRPVAWGASNSFNGASHFLIILSRKDVTAESEYFKHVFQDIKGMNEPRFEKMKKTFTNFQQHEFKLSTPEQINDWASKQTYIMLANMMYTAALLGIDSCPIEGFDKAKCNEILSDYCDMSNFTISSMVSFGYHQGDIPPKVRRPINSVVETIE